RILHPFMPFVTEYLWDKLYEASALTKPKLSLKHYITLEPSLMIAPFPKADKRLIDEDAEESVSALMEVIRGIRQIKSRFGLNPKMNVPVVIASEDESLLEKFKREEEFMKLMAFVSDVSYTNKTTRPIGAASEVVKGGRIFVPLAGLVDIEKEREKTKKELAQNEERIERLEALLSKEEFLKNAPPEVVEKQRTSLEEAKRRKEILRTALDELST
ncbi:MAG: class I tRNA ligase family protein, partial [Planctomycetota bacterium]|nr:class I tRNA ligase family protein [Planctomycetota bacterium]